MKTICRIRSISWVMIVLILLLFFIYCGNQAGKLNGNNGLERQDMVKERLKMVEVLRAYGISDARVLAAMEKVKRHVYIPLGYRWKSDPYGDHPCFIGYNQTISQPYIVAYMTEKIGLKPGEKVLEIGTGSGYQAAILAELGGQVFSVEIIEELAQHAREVLKEEGYGNVKVLTGNGYNGWPEYAPYDIVIVTCAPEKVPQNLVDQLKENGRMILPVGTNSQRLVILRKKNGKVKIEEDLSVTFVPMVQN